MWEIESSIWDRCDWMDDTYYSPSNKQELLEKQQRDEEHKKLFPKEYVNNK